MDITLSLDSNILREIRNDSEAQEISINSKINSILIKYISFYKHAETHSCLFLPRVFNSLIIEQMDEDKLIQTMKNRNLNEIPILFTLNNIAPTLENLIEKCFRRLILWSGMYQRFKAYTYNEGYRCLLFEHNYSIKWSRMLGAVFSDLIENLLNMPTKKIEVFPSATLIRLEKQKIKNKVILMSTFKKRVELIG